MNAARIYFFARVFNVSEDRSIGGSICLAERTANMNHLELEPMIIGRNFKEA